MSLDQIDINPVLKLMGLGMFDEAKISLEELLRRDPKNTDLLYNLGIVYVEIGDAKRAQELLFTCIRLDPDYSNAYVAVGLIYYRQGDLGRAKETFLQAIRINPSNLFALKNVGSLLGKEGDIIKSLYYLKRAFSLHPYDPHTILNLAMAYKDLREMEKAEKYFRMLLDMNPPEALRAVALENLEVLAVGEPQPLGLMVDAVFYLLGIIRILRERTSLQIQEIVSEITMLGRHGLDFEDPGARYALRSLAGEFNSSQLVCTMYVALRQFPPGANIGVDLSEEYELALELAGDDDLL
jgi:tetratricopeptide (TPR) repeat protein